MEIYREEIRDLLAEGADGRGGERQALEIRMGEKGLPHVRRDQ